MIEFLRNLRSGLWAVLHPQPWPEPDEDVVTPAAFRQWVAGRKHPAKCSGGCRCEVSSG